MARTQTFTQEQLDKTKQALSELPDLSRNKIAKADFLESLKDQIVSLASTKGYSPAEIKSALAQVNVTVSVKSIADLLNTQGKRQPRKAIDKKSNPTP